MSKLFFVFYVFFFTIPEFILMCGSRYRINCLGSRKIEFQSLFCHTPSLKTKTCMRQKNQNLVINLLQLSKIYTCLFCIICSVFIFKLFVPFYQLKHFLSFFHDRLAQKYDFYSSKVRRAIWMIWKILEDMLSNCFRQLKNVIKFSV